MRIMRLGTVGGLSVLLLMGDAYVGAMAMSVESNGWIFRSIDIGGSFDGLASRHGLWILPRRSRFGSSIGISQCSASASCCLGLWRLVCVWGLSPGRRCMSKRIFLGLFLPTPVAGGHKCG